MNEFWNGVIQFIQQPIVIAGLGSFTIGGVIAIVVKLFFGAKKGDIRSLKAQISAIKQSSDNFITKEKIVELNAFLENVLNVVKDLASQIKNEKEREKLLEEINKIELPKEEVVEEIVEKVKKIF